MVLNSYFKELHNCVSLSLDLKRSDDFLLRNCVAVPKHQICGFLFDSVWYLFVIRFSPYVAVPKQRNEIN